ncbi:MAG: D-alanyl-D-alanine carboxypeptidase/D-alanyl-D-alanine-endopeptidase [Candidatus Caldarchaeum sp.]
MLAAICAFANLFYQDLHTNLEGTWAEQDLKGVSIGVLVKEIGGEVLYTKNPDTPVVPASLVKLATAIIVLEVLGPDYAPVTCAWREGDTVYLWGGGDPGVTVQDLLSLAEVLRVEPTDKVVFDDSLFGVFSRPSTWESSDLPYGYAAPIHSLTVNGGKVELWVEGTRAYLMPRNFGLRVIGHLQGGSLKITVEGRQRVWTVKVPGGAGSAEPKKVATLSLPDPALCAGRVFHPQARRGRVPSPPQEILFSSAPLGISQTIDKQGRVLVCLRRRTVAQLLKTMFEQSDNVYAETLFRLATLKMGGAQSWEDSVRVASEVLCSVGLKRGAFTLADGSGLSRKNRLTPRAVVHLLERGILSPYSHVFLDGLAEPGEGTMKERLLGIPVASKTGTLSGVSCLAGVIWGAVPALEGPGRWEMRGFTGLSSCSVFYGSGFCVFSYPVLLGIGNGLIGRSFNPSRPSDFSLPDTHCLQIPLLVGPKGLLFCIVMASTRVPAKRLREVQDAIVVQLYQHIRARNSLPDAREVLGAIP